MGVIKRVRPPLLSLLLDSLQVRDINAHSDMAQ